MSFSFRLKSHPNKLLRHHLENVGKLSRELLNYKEMENKDLFFEVAYLIGASHDFGKATTSFQEMLSSGEKTKYANHGFLSSLFGYYIIKDFLQKINKIETFWYMPVIAWIVINKHHGDINDIGELNGEISRLDDSGKINDVVTQIENIVNNTFDEVRTIYKEVLNKNRFQEFINLFSNPETRDNFVGEIRKDALKISRQGDIKYYFSILFFYSILLDSDKLDASETSIPQRTEISKDTIDTYKKIKFSRGIKCDINKFREEAYREVNRSIYNLDLQNERILSINLPTGIGKTLAGLSFALNLREKIKEEAGFTPKVIYSLPFLSIIDQNGSILAEILAERCGVKWEDLFKMNVKEKESILKEKIPSNLLLKHHHLADIKYKEEKDSELNIIEDINKSLLLTEGWHSEIVITTFVQFFHSLITNKNRAARKFHNMINSIIILDEIQSIPHEYWLLVNVVLKHLAENLNCWIILMTATEPLIFEKGEIKELIDNKKKYFELFDRVGYNFDVNEKDFDEFKKEILDQITCKENKDIMIVLNTITSCKDLYEYLKEKLSDRYGFDPEKYIDENGICNFSDLELINMSTHILPNFRLNRINRIKDGKKRKIIITTQLIEAGVDINVDIIYRDFAPLDCIIQTAGRCNRNNKKEKGVVNVVILRDENHKPFYSYIYDSTLIDTTKEVIKGIDKNVPEKDFTVRAADEYYNLVVERGNTKDSTIIDHLKKLKFSDTSEFKLIEKELPTVSIFVEISDEAKETRRKMEEILREKKGFERREKLLEIRKNINSFTLSINCSKELKEKIEYLPSIGEMEDFRYVPKEDLDKWYKLDIGFQPPEGNTDTIIL